MVLEAEIGSFNYEFPKHLSAHDFTRARKLFYVLTDFLDAHKGGSIYEFSKILFAHNFTRTKIQYIQSSRSTCKYDRY